jgi:transposase InsO family protein
MAATDITETLELALEASGCNTAQVRHRPRLLSDNGPGYIAGELAKWLKAEAFGLDLLIPNAGVGQFKAPPRGGFTASRAPRRASGLGLEVQQASVPSSSAAQGRSQ